jgi:CubicO group peptidase (beta-lactamase class C family)
MTSLRDLLETTVESGRVPGAAALVARGEDVEIAGVGEVEPESIVRIASITKPITAAAVMLLMDEGLVSLDDPIARWLPELASPRVVRTFQSAIDGTGTTAHVAPSTGTIGILLTQLQMTGPTPTKFMREFWQYAFGAF